MVVLFLPCSYFKHIIIARRNPPRINLLHTVQWNPIYNKIRFLKRWDWIHFKWIFHSTEKLSLFRSFSYIFVLQFQTRKKTNVNESIRSYYANVEHMRLSNVLHFIHRTFHMRDKGNVNMSSMWTVIINSMNCRKWFFWEK